MKCSRRSAVLVILMTILFVTLTFASPAGTLTVSQTPGGSDDQTFVTIAETMDSGFLRYYSITQNPVSAPEEFDLMPFGVEYFINGNNYEIQVDYYINVYEVDELTKQITKFGSSQVISSDIRNDLVVSPLPNSTGLSVDSTFDLTFNDDILVIDSDITADQIKDFFSFVSVEETPVTVNVTGELLSGKNFRLTPNEDFQVGKSYKLIYGGGLKTKGNGQDIPGFSPVFHFGQDTKLKIVMDDDIKLEYNNALEGNFKYVILEKEDNYDYPPLDSKMLFDDYKSQLDAHGIDHHYGSFSVVGAGGIAYHSMSNFTPGKEYVMYAGFRDSSLNYSGQFYQKGFLVPDSVKLNITPDEGDVEVELEPQIEYIMSMPMYAYDGSVLTDANIGDYVRIKKTSIGGSEVTYNASVGYGQGKTNIYLNVDPANKLEKDTTYIVQTLTGMKDQYGRTYPGSTSSFKSRPIIDISVDTNDNFQVKYENKRVGKYYVAILPSSTTTTVIASAQDVSDAQSVVDEAEVIPFEYIIPSANNGLSTQVISNKLILNENYDVYFAFQPESGGVWEDLVHESFLYTGIIPELDGGMTLVDHEGTDDATEVSLQDISGIDDKYVYKISSDDGPVTRPILNSILTPGTDGWALLPGGDGPDPKVIPAIDGREIAIIRLDVDNKVIQYSKRYALVNVESPFDSPVAANFVSLKDVLFDFTLIADSSDELFYALYDNGYDTSNLTITDIKDGNSHELTRGSIGHADRLVEIIGDGTYIQDDDYKLVVMMKKANGYYYISHEIDLIDHTQYKTELHLNGGLTTIPGLKDDIGMDIETQVFSTDNDSFEFTAIVDQVAYPDGTLEIILIREDLIPSEDHNQLSAYLSDQLPSLMLESEKRVFRHDYTNGMSNFDTIDSREMAIGMYAAIFRNKKVGDPGEGEVSLKVLHNAAYVVRGGEANMTALPVYQGGGKYLAFHADRLLMKSDAILFDVNLSPLTYDGVEIASADQKSGIFIYDYEKETTTIKIDLAGDNIDPVAGKDFQFALAEAEFTAVGGLPVNPSSIPIKITVTTAMDDIPGGNVEKGNTIEIANNRDQKMEFIMVHSDVVSSVPVSAKDLTNFVNTNTIHTRAGIAPANDKASMDTSGLVLGNYYVLANPVDYADASYHTPLSASYYTLIAASQSGNGGSNSGSSTPPPVEPETPVEETETPVAEEEPTIIEQLSDKEKDDDEADGDVNQELEDFNTLLDQVETPEDAEKGVDIVSDTLENVSDDVAKLEGTERAALVENITNIIGNAEELLTKVDEKTNKVDLVDKIIKSSKKIIDALNQQVDKPEDQGLVNQVNNSLIDLANKVIQEQSKVVLEDRALIMPEDIQGPVENGLKTKKQLEASLQDAGINQELKELKTSLVVKVKENTFGSQSVGFHRDTLASLGESVASVNLDFGKTKIKVTKEVLENAKGNMFFTNEDVASAGAPDPNEAPDPNDAGTADQANQPIAGAAPLVRQLEAFEDGKRITEFEKPVKVSFDVEDFGFKGESDEELSNLVVMVLNEESNEWEPTGGVYDPVTKSITFYRIHMSKYTVVKNKKKFSDVKNSWAKDEINNLLGKGIVDVKSEFRPNDEITREEFAAWICRAYGLKEEGYEADFKDLDKSNPYYNEIANASSKGLIFGRDTDTFDPKKEITREEMATLVARAVSNYNDVKVPSDGAARFASLSDGVETSDWAVDSVAMMIDMGIMKTDENGNFNPQEAITKEAAADIFTKIYN